MQGVHFTILAASPCAAKFYEIWHTRSAHQHNYVCQICSQSVQGLQSSDTPKIAISHWLAASPLQHCDMYILQKKNKIKKIPRFITFWRSLSVLKYHTNVTIVYFDRQVRALEQESQTCKFGRWRRMSQFEHLKIEILHKLSWPNI